MNHTESSIFSVEPFIFKQRIIMKIQISKQIVAGTLNIYRRGPPAQIRSIQNVFHYTVNRPFDLAVVKLDRDFKLDPLVGPIQLSPQGFFPNG